MESDEVWSRSVLSVSHLKTGPPGQGFCLGGGKCRWAGKTQIHKTQTHNRHTHGRAKSSDKMFYQPNQIRVGFSSCVLLERSFFDPKCALFASTIFRTWCGAASRMRKMDAPLFHHTHRRNTYLRTSKMPPSAGFGTAGRAKTSAPTT